MPVGLQCRALGFDFPQALAPKHVSSVSRAVPQGELLIATLLFWITRSIYVSGLSRLGFIPRMEIFETAA
jgi:hypothetical protein